MSIQEKAAQLRAMNPPMGVLMEVKVQIEQLGAQAAQILGEGAAGFQEVQAAVQYALSEVDGTYNALAMLESALNDAATRHSG